jgi:hypothetical protein
VVSTPAVKISSQVGGGDLKVKSGILNIIIFCAGQIKKIYFLSEISDEAKKKKQKNLYENFVRERDRGERGLVEDQNNKPRQGAYTPVSNRGRA